MEYQFIEFTKNIINNYKNRNYLILNWVFHGGGATQSMKIEPPNPFGQSHAIHCSEPLNPRRGKRQIEPILKDPIWNDTMSLPNGSFLFYI